MEKAVFGRIIRLDEELRKAGIEKKTVDKIMEGGNKILKTSRPADKAAWMKIAMDRMDSLLPEETRVKVREECACCTTGSRLKLMKKLSEENKDLDSFFKAVDNSHVFGKKVEKKGNKVYVNFGGSKCVCTPKVSNEIFSTTYCQCCKGHVKKLLESALKRELKVDIVQTACSGGKTCSFVIYLD